MPLAGVELCWGCVPGVGLAELAHLAAAHGFSGISARPGQYLDAVHAGRGWRSALASSGMSVGVVDALLTHLPGSPQPRGLPAIVRDAPGLDACLEAAVELGARTLNVAHFLGRTVDPAALRDSLAEIVDVAAPAGVRVSLEFMPGTGVPDLATALAVVGSGEGAGVLFDTWHHLRAGGSLGELSRLRAAQIVEAQLSDRVPPVPGEAYVPMTGRLAPGDGTSPLREMVAALRSVSPGLVFGIEVFGADGTDPEATVARLARATVAVLDTYPRARQAERCRFSS